MLKGIDISNWQTGLNIRDIACDFTIVKATEGLGYVDPSCDKFVQDCIAIGRPWGFYHFARENDPKDEARFFYDSCKNYFGHGVPCLDYETENANNAKWCEAFIEELHRLSGVYAMLYISASRCKQYAGSWIPQKCGLWVAGYPANYTEWVDGNAIPYDCSPWEFVAIWQFTSSLFGMSLDGNIAYMDSEAWGRYAASSKAPEPSGDDKPNVNYDSIAQEVIAGKWGNGDERRQRLERNGYDYDAVQTKVNKLYQIAHEVVNGKWGNGWNREQALKGAGYPYETVQRIVNEIVRRG